MFGKLNGKGRRGEGRGGREVGVGQVMPRNFDDVNHLARIHPEYRCNDPERPASEGSRK